MVFALKTAYDTYLRFRYEENLTYGLLQASADKVADSYAQFEFLNSETYVGLVHIRCRYNNKYWVRWSQYHYWLVAAADKPNDDKNDWACTLFERIDLGDDVSTGMLRLKHVELGHYVRVLDAGVPFEDCLFADGKEVDENSMDVFTFVNLNKLFSPVSKRVAFKGDNGKYLGLHMRNGIECLQFAYDNLDDPKTIHEMFSTPHGIFYIRSSYSNKFWRCDDDKWIKADCEDSRPYTNDASFRIVPLGINVISVISMKNQSIAERFTSIGFQDCLKAATQDVNPGGKLQVIELGSSN